MPQLEHRKISVALIIYLLLVGGLWEIYEYKAGLTFYSIDFIFDTISDLSMDLCGGLFAYLIADRFKI